MSTTWETSTSQQATTFTTVAGASSGVYTFNTPVSTPSYTTSFVNFIGTWETLQTIWSQVNNTWGDL